MAAIHGRVRLREGEYRVCCVVRSRGLPGRQIFAVFNHIRAPAAGQDGELHVSARRGHAGQQRWMRSVFDDGEGIIRCACFAEKNGVEPVRSEIQHHGTKRKRGIKHRRMIGQPCRGLAGTARDGVNGATIADGRFAEAIRLVICAHAICLASAAGLDDVRVGIE